MSSEVPREKALFCRALEIGNLVKRRQYLVQACGTDQSLRERVEKLLAVSQNAGDFFNDCAPALGLINAEQVVSAISDMPPKLAFSCPAKIRIGFPR